jgi:hypothetical protein
LDEVKTGKPEGKQPTEKSVSVQPAKGALVHELWLRVESEDDSREIIRQSKMQVCMSFDLIIPLCHLLLFYSAFRHLPHWILWLCRRGKSFCDDRLTTTAVLTTTMLRSSMMDLHQQLS